jgi:hypothetical protein
MGYHHFGHFERYVHECGIPPQDAYKWRNIDVIYDPDCPVNHTYMLDFRYLHLRYVEGESFLYGNLISSNPATQGVLVG